MSFSSDYNKLRNKRKKKEDEKETGYTSLKFQSTDDIAPYNLNRLPGDQNNSAFDRYDRVRSGLVEQHVLRNAEEEKQAKKEGVGSWFKGSGLFDDGYQFGDVTKAILGTRTDLGEEIGEGAMEVGEKVVDFGAMVAGTVGGWFGADDFRKKTDEFVAKDLYDSEKLIKEAGKYIGYSGLLNLMGAETESASILGEKSEGLANSAGQLALTAGMAPVVPWWVTSGATSFGAEAENALNQGATHEEAMWSASISAASEILTEKLFGGSGLGEKGLINTNALTKGISSKFVKTLADYGVDLVSEGSEEIVAEFAGNFASSLYKEESLSELLFSEEAVDSYIDAFVGGMALGGGMNVGKVTSSIQSGRDYRTGLTSNEQKVFDKELENRIAEAEKDGKKLSKKDKAAIYDEVMEHLEKGYISTDTIEEVLGGKTYKDYKTTVEAEDSILKEFESLYEGDELKRQTEEFLKDSKRFEAKDNLSREVYELVKDGKLGESYLERARRSESFTADLSKYDTKYHTTIQNAINSGTLNNTRRTHELVDMIAKISADKGVLFDFTNNEKIKGTSFAVEGKIVNGYVTESGDITLNVESPKYLNTTVGHEITHVLEGTEFYNTLQETIFEYAKSKNDYNDRLTSLRELYKGVKGYEGVDGFNKIKNELTADLVGDYLFTDSDFVHRLSTEHRNIFQKIYDEIKYLCKVATAGSKEARQLEKVKKTFEEAYRGESKAKGETKHSLSDADYLSPQQAQVLNVMTSNIVNEATRRGISLEQAAIATQEINAFNPTKADAKTFADAFEPIVKQLGNENYYGYLDKMRSYAESESDTKYSLSDSEGRQLSKEQSEYFKDSKVKDENGNLKVVYHGSPADFNTFSLDYLGTNGTAEGYGFYFTDKKHIAEGYSKGYEGQQNGEPGKLFEVYLDIKKPLSDTEVTMTRSQFKKFLTTLNNQVDADGERLDVLSNYGDVEWEGLNKVLNYAMEIEYDGSDSDVNLVHSIINGCGATKTVFNVLRKTLGYDGIIVEEATWGGDQTIYVAFHPEQIKNVDNNAPTSNPDIRYSLSDDSKTENVVSLDGGTVAKYSLSTWTPETQTKVRENLVKAGYEKDRVDKWIKDTNSVAAVIAADRDRLDFEAADNQVMLKDNQEYIKTLDASTLCAKRLVYQGTFDAIQHRMPNTMLSSDDLIDLLNMMKEHGVQTPCGVCYVESRRRHLGKFAQDWLNGYKGEYKPNLDEVTTSDGLEALRKSHPDTYKDFVDAMNKKGSSNPKVVQLRTEYRNEIMSLTPAQIRKIEAIGGLRVQSFSDFETPHMLDMMQAVMDMSAKGLHSQACTKVPNFAWVFGDTGIKINLSLIAEGDGFDADGNLAFSSTEGMNLDDAMKLRDAYSQNVGTIIVGANDKHILACMADDRIDFIIPFHRSGWGMKELDMMGMSSYTDYTYGQKEHDLATGKGVENLYPPDYWDYNLSGKENAERYLNLCAKTGREPKFSKFLVNNGDGSYSLQPDGSTDGYWKTLIDFKMYDNEGNGAAQQKVQPNFNMEEAYRVLQEYEGGANKLPVANDVVEEFVAKYQSYEELAPAMSLSNIGEQPRRFGNFNISGKDVMLESAPVIEKPVPESVAPVAEATDMFPDNAQNLDSLLAEQSNIRNALEYAASQNDIDTVNRLLPEYESVSEKVKEMQDAENQRLASLDDADIPPEMDAPYYGEPQKPVTPDDPFADRDWYKVGNQKVKSYMDENPIVKPFFQDEARSILMELSDTTKGERWYDDRLYYESGGEKGFGGVSRHTSDSIAEMLDSWHLSYADIEKGLNEIIEDSPKKSAAAKKIEFMLNDRLLHGYKDYYSNRMVSPNQEYINLLNQIQTVEYSPESFDNLVAHADEYAPFVEDVAPVVEAPVAEKPVKEAYEAIKPKQSKEPRMARATPEEQARDSRTAKILFDQKQTPKQKSAWKWAREHIFSRGAVFEDMSLKTGNRELQAKFDNIRRAESRAQTFIGKGKGNAKALVDVRKMVEKSGKTEDFNYYLYHLHNVDRMTLEQRFKDVPNKSVFGDSVDAETSRKAALGLEVLNPEFKQWAEDVYAINRHLRQMMVDEGVISQETADLWQTMYPHYVPISRADAKGLNVNVPLDTKRTGINAPIKKATGGNSDFYNVFDTMGSRIEQTYKAIAKNRFGVELMNTLGTAYESDVADIDTVLDTMDQHEELLQEGKNGESPSFTVFRNGERVKFAITEDMYDAMKPSQFTYTNKALKTINDIRRDILTTYSPTFALTNPIKDVQDILLNSQHPARTYATIPEAVYSVISKNHWYQERMENGGNQDSYFDGQTKTFKKEGGWFKKAMGFVPSKIQAANEIIEQVPRMAEYIASRKMGRSIDVSMLDAARVTTNFGAPGDFTNMLNRNGFTFLGASIEGFNQQVRNVREAKAEGMKGVVKLAAKYLVAGLPALLLNHVLWDDDEEYEELSDYVKQNYYIVGKTEDGKFVRIPKGRAVSVIQDAFKQMENLITGNDDVDLESFGQLVVNNLAPNNPLENNLIAPIVQATTNKTWYGDDLVPTRLQDVPVAEQFDETTDSISKWLGEATNTSPYKWNYLLDQYTGGVGDMVLPYLTTEADGGGLGAAFRDKFVSDPVLKNQNVTDFYDKVDELTVNANSSKATDEDVLKNKYMSSVSSEMGKLYQQKREIQNSNLSDEEKYAQVRDIQRQIDDLARESLATYENVNINNGYATIGDLHYRWYEPGEDSNAEPGWQKITDKQLKKQEEVTSALGIDGSEYWSNNEEYDFAYESPEKYAVAKAVGGYTTYKTYSSELYDIKADKDENGKSISGSRKDKVADYINNLDIDYGMKIILFKSEYNADDTYNYEIIDYLNSREDIDYEEMETILKELGFSVSSNGTITWD